MATKVQAYSENGVKISKAKISVGDKITLTYEGLLLQSGADSIFAHIGYGNQWDDKAYIPMERVDGAFQAEFKVTMPGSLNISFKDGADNWDNNSYANYSFKVENKEKAEKAAAPKKAVAVKKEKAASKPAKAEKTEKAVKPKKATAKTETKAKK